MQVHPAIRGLALVSAAAAALTGCHDGRDTQLARDRANTLVIATSADADNLIPPLVMTTQGKQVVDQIYDNLAAPTDPVATFGDAGFRPQLARSWKWAPDSLSIAFELDPHARWQDGAAVRASDVRFSYAVYTDTIVGSPHASDFAGIDSVTVRDSLTAVVWWKHRSPEQFFQIAYNLAIMPEHLLGGVPRSALSSSAFAQHPIGSGRYRFASWEHGAELRLTADTSNFRGRPHFDRVTWVVRPDPTAATASVLSGEADFIETMRSEGVARAHRTPSVRTVEYGTLDYGFVVFNERRDRRDRRGGPSAPLFADRGLRIALTRGINREAVVRSALDSLARVALGPFTRSQASADTTLHQISFDSAGAARALDSLGWHLARTGVRVRRGQPLEFSLLVPSSSKTRMRLAVLLQSQLARVGAKVIVDPAEPAVFVDRLQKGDFDAAIHAWHSDPSPSTLRQLWGSPQGGNMGANYGGYSSRVVDALVDSGAVEFQPRRRAELFRRAYQALVDDAPAIWLYEPRNITAVQQRITPVGMRADAWWANIADWQIARKSALALR